jgi:hypothetical protein
MSLQASSFRLLQVYMSHISIGQARVIIELDEGGAERVLRR